MANVIADKKLRPAIADRVRKGQCLCCTKKAARRGLCQSCYRFFTLAMAKLPSAKRTAFEERAIREGKILATNQVKQIRYPNPFVDSPWPAARAEGGDHVGS